MSKFHLPLKACIFLWALSYLTSCKQKQDESIAPQAQPDTTQTSSSEQAYPTQDCIWQDGILAGTPIRYGIINGQAIYQGDIILSPQQLAPEGDAGGRISGAGTSDKLLRWRNFTIPYTISSSLPNKERVTEAIKHWEARTPLRFVQRTSEEDYVTFRKDSKESGCFSELGRVGGRQFINVDDGCSMGNVIHEIGHTVGLLHEQNRSDRNDYVMVHDQNIYTNEKDQFLPYNQNPDVNGFNYSKFDFGSVMLYDSYASSKNQLPTMTLLDGKTTFTAQRKGLSGRDVSTVNAMYSNLYINWRGILYAVVISDGSYASIPADLSKTSVSKTMAEDDRHLWLISEGTLYRVNRLNGNKTSFGGGWKGALGVTGIVGGDTRWAIQGKDLYAINKQGKRVDVDNFDWGNSQGIFAHMDYLFIVDGKNNLWKLDMNTSKWIVLNNRNWFNVRGMAVTSSTSNNLYIIQGDVLWRINISTGAFTQVSNGWSGTEDMVGISGKLYIVADGILWEVNTNGNRRSLGGGWQGTLSMGIIRNGNVL